MTPTAPLSLDNLDATRILHTRDFRSGRDVNALRPIDPEELRERRMIEAYGFTGARSARALAEYADRARPVAPEAPPEFVEEVRRALGIALAGR
jgi:hypothetical protein